jgi:peptidoglycan-N-acetylglucosamine deacetylase
MKAAFTIDDLPLWPQAYPPEGYTAGGIVDSIIEALDHHKIRGVYAFCNSWSLVKHPEFSRILDRWTDAGHFVGNHTHAHAELNDVRAEEYIDEIDLADVHLAPWLSKAPSKFFRYTLCHWGDTEEKRERVRSHLSERGYIPAEGDDVGLRVAMEPRFSKPSRCRRRGGRHISRAIVYRIFWSAVAL